MLCDASLAAEMLRYTMHRNNAAYHLRRARRTATIELFGISLYQLPTSHFQLPTSTTMHLYKERNCGCSKIAWILVIIGALNWGLTGVGYFLNANGNIINLLLGRMSWLEALIYVLVGIAAVVTLFGCRCKRCREGCVTCDPNASSVAAASTAEHM